MAATDLEALEALGEVEPFTGFGVRVGESAWLLRTLLQPVNGGFSITNASGVDADPQFELIGDLLAVEKLGDDGPAVGFGARTAPEQWALRALLQPTNGGFTITDGDGAANSPQFELIGDLLAVETLGDTGDEAGFGVRTAADTWALRTIVGTANEIAVTYGDGVDGDPTISLPAQTDIIDKELFVGASHFIISDVTDATKTAVFDASGISTATLRTIALPDASGTMALVENTQEQSALLSSLAALTVVAGDMLFVSDTDTISRLPKGTNGQFAKLVSGLPAWVSDNPVRTVGVQAFSASGTYTPTTGMVFALAVVVGAGGGGGGALVGAAALMSLAAGGGAGGSTAISVLSAATVGASKYVNIGTGGSGGVGNASGATGSTSGIGTGAGDYSLMQAPGGAGGSPATNASAGLNFGAGGAGATATTGDVKIYGTSGSYGSCAYNTTAAQCCAQGGHGGGSFFAQGARSPTVKGSSSIAGTTAVGAGAGGAGAAIAHATNATSATGGAGANGYCIILEFIS